MTYCDHAWQGNEPPEWTDTSDWDDAAWASWYDEAGQHCSRCGISDEE